MARWMPRERRRVAERNLERFRGSDVVQDVECHTPYSLQSGDAMGAGRFSLPRRYGKQFKHVPAWELGFIPTIGGQWKNGV